MTIAQSMLAEFETQAPITRRFLERLPEDRLTWKPHEKSMSAGQLAYHLAFVPGGAIRFVQNNPAQAPEFADFPQPASRQEILKTFDEGISTVRELLPQLDDARMGETWRMVSKEQEVLAHSRGRSSCATSCLATGISIAGNSACICVCSMSRSRQAGGPALMNYRFSRIKHNRPDRRFWSGQRAGLRRRLQPSAFFWGGDRTDVS